MELTRDRSTRDVGWIGLDATSVTRWRERLRRTPAVRDIAFTAAERRWAAGWPERYARLWAAKEGAVKAVATGFDGLSWPDVEVDPVRGTARVSGCPTSWRVRWTGHGDHVIALVDDRTGVGRLGMVSRRVTGRVAYAERSVRVRSLAEELVRDLAAVGDVRWDRSDRDAPLLVVDGARATVSLTHGDGLLGAAVAILPDGSPESIQ